MLIMWGHRWESHPLDGGIRVRQRCPKCRCETQFMEVVPKKHFTLYTFKVVEMETGESRMECENCRTQFHIPEGLREKWLKEMRSKPADYVHCPHCEKKLKVPFMDKEIRITCQDCKKQFSVIRARIMEKPFWEELLQGNLPF
jgi:uncharacterized protein YbaR (Trm112 family)